MSSAIPLARGLAGLQQVAGCLCAITGQVRGQRRGQRGRTTGTACSRRAPPARAAHGVRHAHIDKWDQTECFAEDSKPGVGLVVGTPWPCRGSCPWSGLCGSAGPTARRRSAGSAAEVCDLRTATALLPQSELPSLFEKCPVLQYATSLSADLLRETKDVPCEQLPEWKVGVHDPALQFLLAQQDTGGCPRVLRRTEPLMPPCA